MLVVGLLVNNCLRIKCESGLKNKWNIPNTVSPKLVMLIILTV